MYTLTDNPSIDQLLRTVGKLYPFIEGYKVALASRRLNKRNVHTREEGVDWLS